MTLNVKELNLDMIHKVRLRAEDAEECAAFGLTEQEAVVVGVRGSKEAWVLSAGEVPLVYGGYAPIGVLSDAARVWMLGTPEAVDFAVPIARLGRRALRGALEMFREVRVSVVKSNAPGVRWAEWLGFRAAYSAGPFIEYVAKRGNAHGGA